MASVSTEDFPYTLAYVTQMLNVDEAALMQVVQALDLTPARDPQSGNIIFSHRETEILRKAVEMNRRGEDLSKIASYFGVRKQAQAYGSESHVSIPRASGEGQMTVPGGVSNLKVGRDNLAVVVEAVSNAKEGILKDMSRLLDDKLSGLDEVVVELIRCKSENDALKQKAKALAEEKESLQFELSRYKSAGFGFFRKI